MGGGDYADIRFAKGVDGDETITGGYKVSGGLIVHSLKSTYIQLIILK